MLHETRQETGATSLGNPGTDGPRGNASEDRGSHGRFVSGLLGLAALSLLATCFFSFVVPQTPGRMGRASAELIPRLPIWSWLTSLPIPVPDASAEVALALAAFTGVAFAAYAAALYLSWGRDVPGRVLLVVAGAGLALSLVNAWALPNLNTDIYNYIARGRVAAVHGENPYRVAVDDYPDDPVYPYASHRFTDEPGGKLPAWMPLNIALARIGGDSPVDSLITYRLALFLISAANLALIVLIVRELAPGHELAGAVFYAWNPIVIQFAQSKTDTLMVFYLLLAVWLLVRGRPWWLFFSSLLLSVFVKLLTAPLVVVYMVRSLVLKRWRELAGGVAIGAAFAGILYLTSGELMELLGYAGEAGGAAPGALQLLVQAGFLVVIVGAGLAQDGSVRRLLLGFAAVMIVFSLFVTRITLTWYLLTPIAIVAVLDSWRLALVTVAISLPSFLVNAWNGVFTADFPAPDLILSSRLLLYLFLPALAVGYLVARMGWRRFRTRLPGTTSGPEAPAASGTSSSFAPGRQGAAEG